jgi:hypothetical protein
MEYPVTDRSNTRLLGPLLASVIVAVLSMGCAASESSSADAGDPTHDAATGGTGGYAPDEGLNGDDAPEGAGGDSGGGPAAPSAGNPDALVNNPIEQLFADGERTPFDFFDGLGTGPQSYADTASICYADAADCESSLCTPFAACCVATGRCCMPPEVSPLPESLSFIDCSGGAVEDCAASKGYDAVEFGDRGVLITSRGLVPNGDATSEGGTLLGDAVALTNERVTVTVTFAYPRGCNGTCLESAGVAFTSDDGTDRFNGAAVGLLFSGSRERVSLLIGGQTVDAYPAADASATWTLALSPAGTVEVASGDATLGVYAFDPEPLSSARLAVFGRSLFSNANSAAVSSLSTTVELCDSPRGWTERTAVNVTLDGGPSSGFASASEPSLLDDPFSNTVAFEADGSIYLGELADGVVEVSSVGARLVESEPYEAGGIGEPELFTFADTLLLYYAAFDDMGAGSIRSASLIDDELVKSVVPVLVPDGDVVSYDSPTVSAREGLVVLVARATLASDATELRIFYTSDPSTGWAPIVDGSLEAITRIDGATEDVTGPSLIVHNSAYQLYYARRVGTRWTVEVAASDELLFWRPLGEALGPSGSGFDRLGARSLDARSGFDEIDALYMGQDDVSFGLGRVARPAPSDTASAPF